MARFLKGSGLIKQANQAAASRSVVIGGMDETEIASKQQIIDELIEAAKQKAFEESSAIINQAKLEAEKIIQIANDKSSSIEQAAYEKGYADGTQAGLTQINQDLAFALVEIKNILENIEEERKEALEDESNRLYSIIVLISKKLLLRDLSINPDLSMDFIQKAIALLDHKSQINILVNPMVAKKLNEIKAQIINANPGLENLLITANSDLNLGDLILESNKERLDCRLETQLERLLESLITENNKQ